jgi:DNA repair protein RadC
MRENLIELLATMLQNNMGNKITVELASGLLTTFNQQWVAMEEKQKSSHTTPES